MSIPLCRKRLNLYRWHYVICRKRLNKSNYTSENISPELAKGQTEIKGVPNETVEDVKDQSGSVNQENPAFRNPDNKLYQSPKSDWTLTFNKTDEYVDKLLYVLQSSNGLKFNFEKTSKISYYDFLKFQSKRTRRKGPGLPIYRNYNGG